jgi:hypothetical protein
MAKIHNMFRLVGDPGTDEFTAPVGMQLVNTIFLGIASADEKADYISHGGNAGGLYKVLYVLVPEPVAVPSVVPVAAKVGRPAKNE